MTPAVVAIHGAVANGATWEPVRRLFPAAYGFAAPDLPGHGALRNRPFTFDAAVRVIADAVAAFAGQPIILAGDSLGGYLALAVAAQARVPLAGVVAGGCTFAIAGAGGALARASGVAQDAAVALVGERRAERALAAVTRRVAGTAIGDAVAERGFRLASRGESLAELARHDTLADVGRIAAPIVFINGAWDWPLRSGEGTFLRAARDARLVVVPRNGHGVGFTAPAAFAAAIASVIPR